MSRLAEHVRRRQWKARIALAAETVEFWAKMTQMEDIRADLGWYVHEFEEAVADFERLQLEYSLTLEADDEQPEEDQPGQGGDGSEPDPVATAAAGPAGAGLLRVAAGRGAPGRVREEPDVRLREICCDTCPLSPTCEEENDFLRSIGLADEWGDELDELDIGTG